MQYLDALCCRYWPIAAALWLLDVAVTLLMLVFEVAALPLVLLHKAWVDVRRARRGGILSSRRDAS